MRSPLFFIAGMIALAAACGGQTVGGIPDHGDGGSSSSGGSSSGGGSGSSSGISSSSSSGSATCKPLPGCGSSTECSNPDGCGICYCEGGNWACAETGCGDDAVDAQPPPDSPDDYCPPQAPQEGTICYVDGLDCGYGSNGGCGESCDCANGVWTCSGDPCPPPECPPSEPAGGTACSSIGIGCGYPSPSGCGGDECNCDPSGIWYCSGSTCIDGGFPSDGGIADASSVCPGFVPPQGSACDDQGAVCSYDTGCETSCLCASTGWVCASQQGCQ